MESSPKKKALLGIAHSKNDLNSSKELNESFFSLFRRLELENVGEITRKDVRCARSEK